MSPLAAVTEWHVAVARVVRLPRHRVVPEQRQITGDEGHQCAQNLLRGVVERTDNASAILQLQRRPFVELRLEQHAKVTVSGVHAGVYHWHPCVDDMAASADDPPRTNSGSQRDPAADRFFAYSTSCCTTRPTCALFSNARYFGAVPASSFTMTCFENFTSVDDSSSTMVEAFRSDLSSSLQKLASVVLNAVMTQVGQAEGLISCSTQDQSTTSTADPQELLQEVVVGLECILSKVHVGAHKVATSPNCADFLGKHAELLFSILARVNELTPTFHGEVLSTVRTA
eukprot:CAMPEP_0117517690 /NCGR_PEP_ID=MMETSP0784-20121206/31743_1 /TAXON_ID=39447 /ORGANISM="" /LENGTH=284 /DNA_ID=CAMNT_0005313581 /DNA_START=425 /DNA_END=1282 /DNA_ORIENTATION=-